MKLASEIEKDAKQFMRERRTLILLVAAPLLVLFVMGAIFSGDSTLAGKTAIGICDLDGSNSSSLFVSGIANSSGVIDYGNGTNCSSSMEMDVRKGKLAAGIVIPAGFENGILLGDTQNVSMVLDNSRFQVSQSIEAFVKANVQETDKRIGTQFILSVWQRLDNASAKLGTIISDMNDTRQKAAAMKSGLQKTAASLNSLNISRVRDEISLANSTVAQASASLDSAESNLTRIESDFASYDATLSQTKSDLLEINDTLANVSSYLVAAKGGINCSNIVFVAYCLSLDSINQSVESAHLSVEQRISKVEEAQNGLVAANVTIQEFKADIASARVGIADSKDSIGNMMGFVNELETDRNGALRTIADVDTSLNDMVAKTYELEDIIANSRDQINEITSRSPGAIISPMLVSSVYLFGKRPFFEFMLPSILPLILMFISLFLASTSLVKEKYGGTLARVYVSQVNRFKYAAVKVLSYSIVLLPEAILLTLIASVFYNAFPVSDLNAWFYVTQALALLVLAFVSAGVLIAIYAESEATAFLASLVIGLPLLFLSGLLFPFEFMPPLISNLGILSPLTQAILSMQATLLYNSPQFASSWILLLYSAVLTALAGLSLKK